jgi:hypothetical protein
MGSGSEEKKCRIDKWVIWVLVSSLYRTSKRATKHYKQLVPLKHHQILSIIVTYPCDIPEQEIPKKTIDYSQDSHLISQSKPTTQTSTE